MSHMAHSGLPERYYVGVCLTLTALFYFLFLIEYGTTI